MFEEPNYEFEGWVVKPPFVLEQGAVWIRGELKADSPEDAGGEAVITGSTRLSGESGFGFGVDEALMAS